MARNSLMPIFVAVATVVGIMGITLAVVYKQEGQRAADLFASMPTPGLTVLEQPRPAPDVTFKDGSGQDVRLESLRGKLVVINLWATWCGPCVQEMPSLDRLGKAMAGPRFAVFAVSEDINADMARKFHHSSKLGNLALYLDPGQALTHALNAQGLPTTVVIDGQGRILAQAIGATEWDSAEMIERLKKWLPAS
ncbi:MAG: TlpA family protein disulfide reductase [Alphaproteobacteria bacterium]|nr:TlpA family protein disulfide reductase [Alphaproteobacteria bacterium]